MCSYVDSFLELQVEVKKTGSTLGEQNCLYDYVKHNCTLMQENAGKKVVKLMTLQIEVLRTENNV